MLAAERRAALVGRCAGCRPRPRGDRLPLPARPRRGRDGDGAGGGPGTVKSRTHRALAKLRALLDREVAHRG
ncbi:hypothetical protein V2I01_34335 [Micromonospora sp. BRA006-A]|nr:hypothetical protein [Micromonospora sp. BRA006-A]